VSLTPDQPRATVPDPVSDALWGLSRAVEAQLNEALLSLGRADLERADAVVAGDRAINARRYEIEEMVSGELGSGAAGGERLRLLVAVLYVISDLERIGDHAEGIAKVALMLGRPPMRPLPLSVVDLGDRVKLMLAAGIEALRDRDVEAARRLVQEDDAVDQRYDDIYGELIATMTAEPESVVPCTYQLWATHNLERIADRVTNLCERTVYLVTGEIQDLNVSKY
jgi:phosphate transport system protein